MSPCLALPLPLMALTRAGRHSFTVLLLDLPRLAGTDISQTTAALRRCNLLFSTFYPIGEVIILTLHLASSPFKALFGGLASHLPSSLLTQIFTGGRTAWSSTVTVQGQNIAARYWYDGQFINNAKEDAAEVALRHLRSPALTQHQAYSPSPSSFQGQGGYGHGYAAR